MNPLQVNRSAFLGMSNLPSFNPVYSNPNTLTFISSITAFNSANIQFTGLLNTYRGYRIYIQHSTPVSSDVLICVLGTGAGPTYLTTNYDFSGTVMGIGSQISTFGDSANANIRLQKGGTIVPITGFVDILYANNSNFYPTISFYTVKDSPNFLIFNGYGTYTASQQAVTAIQFSLLNGSNISSGIYSLYGIT